MQWDEGIEGPHLAIASSHSARIGVLAGPGTGKTGLGLMRRVARLLSEGVAPPRILLVSFTRTAAQDLREKVAALGVDGAEAVRATTLHAYCFGLLQRDAVLTITQRNPRPLMRHEADLMLRDLPGDFGDIKERRSRLEAYEAGWARGADDHPGLAVVADDRAFEAATIRWLRHHRAMLIGEVVPLAYNYLRHNPAAEDLQAFDHVIVDEYQDLNFLEQRLLDVLTERNEANLCVAGDDDQSIYQFRHAHPVGIHRYLEDPNADCHEIWTCGRCPRRVLAIANSLISQAPDRDKPTLEPLDTASEGDVAIVQWADLHEEIEGVVTAIVTDVATERRQPGDILVLTHRRKIGEAIRARLLELGVPAHSFFAEEAVRTSESQEALALLRLVCGDDPVALRVLLGLGDASGRAEAYGALSRHCLDIGITERDALELARGGQRFPVPMRALLSRYEDVVARLASVPTELPDLVDALLPGDVDALADLRVEALDLLPGVSTPAELLNELVARITQADIPASPDYVRIMSLHKSKGLTSPVVFIVGAIEGIVPTLRSNLGEDAVADAVAEQRRLTYVAVTRAAEQLVISYCASMEVALAKSMGVRVVSDGIRRRAGELWAPVIASRYLSELGSEAPRPTRGQGWLADYIGT